ncbi:MAG: hypothetical protein O3A13_13215 [Proteobacteria bacterium]|nr:hypothetical protein [Pseudomonadota bacterium]
MITNPSSPVALRLRNESKLEMEINMNASNDRLPGGVKNSTIWMSIALLFVALALSACGGGAGTSSTTQPPVATCVPSDPATAGECGTVIIGLTDADGDFLSYTVDVMSLTLEKANGVIVDVLPNRTRIDFSQYVDLTEFVSVATIPPGVYVAGTIRLDYGDAEVFVEADGAAKPATIVDARGIPIGQTSLKIVLSDRDQLAITKGRTSLLTLDFDLDASHSVDFVSTPAIATAEPFIVAELDPVDTKDIRVRGRLIEANIDEMYYTVALRPFYDALHDFGRMKVNVTNATDIEVNEVAFTGADGLRALQDAGQGTLTVAKGTLNLVQREFIADTVLAGSSVPGNGRDAAKGNVVSRTDDELVVRGGTIILSDATDAARSFFRDDITVTVGPNTVVYKTTDSDRPMGVPVRLLDSSAISIGQSVTVRGTVTVNDEQGVHIDATEGAVLMHVTHLSGLVNTIMPGQVDIDLHAIDRRRVQAFDFTGTGSSPATDADPDNYEVSTGNVLMPSAATGQPVVVYGFPNEFGGAPPDFEGRTIIDYSDVRSALGVGWGAQGTTAPFLMMDENGLLLDNQNPDIDQRHHIKHGPILVDLTTLDSDTLVAPRETGRKLFTLKTSDSLQLYADFNDFVVALTLELNGVNAARSMYARGHYNRDTNVFTAYKIFVYVLEPS